MLHDKSYYIHCPLNSRAYLKYMDNYVEKTKPKTCNLEYECCPASCGRTFCFTVGLQYVRAQAGSKAVVTIEFNIWEGSNCTWPGWSRRGQQKAWQEENKLQAQKLKIEYTDDPTLLTWGSLLQIHHEERRHNICQLHLEKTEYIAWSNPFQCLQLVT